MCFHDGALDRPSATPTFGFHHAFVVIVLVVLILMEDVILTSVDHVNLGQHHLLHHALLVADIGVLLELDHALSDIGDFAANEALLVRLTHLLHQEGLTAG